MLTVQHEEAIISRLQPLGGRQIDETLLTDIGLVLRDLSEGDVVCDRSINARRDLEDGVVNALLTIQGRRVMVRLTPEQKRREPVFRKDYGKK